MERFERVPHKLNDKETAKLGKELADKRLAHTRLHDEKKAFDKIKNEELNVLDDAIETLAHSVKEHVRFEDVLVEWIPDDKDFTIAIKSVKSGKIIRTRPMEEDEKKEALKRNQNPELPFVPKGKKDATPAPSRVTHNGQSLTLVKGNKKSGAGKKPTK